MKIFLSQLMRGKSDLEIKQEREECIRDLKSKYPDAEFIDSLDFSEGSPVYKLGTAIQKMAEADAIYMMPGSVSDGRGCMVELAVARIYGMKILGG